MAMCRCQYRVLNISIKYRRKKHTRRIVRLPVPVVVLSDSGAFRTCRANFEAHLGDANGLSRPAGHIGTVAAQGGDPGRACKTAATIPVTYPPKPSPFNSRANYPPGAHHQGAHRPGDASKGVFGWLQKRSRPPNFDV
jgi:hypothetical protein